MNNPVKEVQLWLNNAYPEYFKYDADEQNSGIFPVKPDGLTGNTTVKALIMALQINLNLYPVDGIFGTKTITACPNIFSGTSNMMLILILQGGLICKGYGSGIFNGVYDSQTKLAVSKIMMDLGLNSADSNYVTGPLLKTILTTEPTVLTTGSNPKVRLVQQYLNGNYGVLFKNILGYIPTGGKYERLTNKALIFAFQKQIDTSPDGIIGTNTYAKMPSISQGCQETELIKILQCALICNKVSISKIDGIYNSSLSDVIASFQKSILLDIDPAVTLGNVNRRTWSSLFISCGDPQRTANAMDTNHQLSTDEWKALYNAGYRYAGRYITKVEGGKDKDLTVTELGNLFSQYPMAIFPIMQESNDDIKYFTYNEGLRQGKTAFSKAEELQLPSNTTIYFAVDFDVTESDIPAVKSYFYGVNLARSIYGNLYEIGIYAPRHICQQIYDLKLARNSFVADRSYGYSGNLGYVLPDNWAFDQFHTETFSGSGIHSFQIDKVIASGRDTGVKSINFYGNDNWDQHHLNQNLIDSSKETAKNILDIIPVIEELEDYYYKCIGGNLFYNPLECCQAVMHFLFKDKYNDPLFNNLLDGNNTYNNLVRFNTSLYDRISPYIIETNISKDGINYVKRYNICKDLSGKLFELPHLMAALAGFLSLRDILNIPKATWFGWAGDFATALNEIAVTSDREPENPPLYHARNRIGRMEPELLPIDDPSAPTQFNYCDIYGNADAIVLYTIITALLNENNNMKANHIHLLSEAMTLYYGTAHIHTFRHKALLFNMGTIDVSAENIAAKIQRTMESGPYKLLLDMKAKSYLERPQTMSAVMNACCLAYAEFMVHDMKSPCEELPFTDIPNHGWEYDSVSYVYNKGYMVGNSPQTFNPHKTLTRSEFVTVLYAVAGKPLTDYVSQYNDVPDGQWYSIPVSWASKNAIVSGYPNGYFGVNDIITREQLVLMIYKYSAGLCGHTSSVPGSLYRFSDYKDISDWAMTAMNWAVSNYVISGTGTKLNPKGNATRVECAAIIRALCLNNLHHKILG